MRKSATVMCVALALGGCSVREAHPPVSSARRAALAPSAAPSAGATESRARPSPDGSSHGSAGFGRYVRSREPQLQFCYREALLKSPKLAGSATIAVTLADDGRVQNAEIVRRAWSGRGSDVVERCVLTLIRAWSFPPVDPRDEHVHSFAVIFTR